jgi:CubicO group peptidase (beta-lactamase class C family)
LFGAIAYRAQFRGDTGCGLVFNGVSQPVAGTTGSHPGNFPGESSAKDDLPAATDHRLDPLLDAAFAEPDREHLRRTRAVVVIRDGQIVGERYGQRIAPDTPLLGWSMTKSIMNALVGILVREGRLSLDGAARVDSWRGPGDSRSRITLDHLMHMSSGLRFDEDMTSPLTDVTSMLLRTPDMAAFATNRPLEVAPGTRWRYSSGTSIIIARVIRNTLDEEEYRRFPRAALFGPLGMRGALLETDASGTFVGSSFMYATARDWARFGLLYLKNGMWNGERLLPEGWVEYTTQPASADRQQAYGAHFWLRIPPEFDKSRAMVPTDAFHAVGHEGQFVTVIPSRGVVIVRLGKTRYRHAWDQGAFVSGVLAALGAAEPRTRQ